MSRIGAVIKRPHRAPSPLYHAMARQEASHRPSPEPAMPAPDLRASSLQKCEKQICGTLVLTAAQMD